jgi:FkbM family methyltransferase
MKFDADNLQRLALRIIKRCLKKINWHFHYGNLTFVFPLGSEYFSHIFLYGSYEPEVMLFLMRFLRPGMNVLDIGANVGLFSILSSSLVGSEGRVWSFEPDPRALKLLKKNLALNNANNVQVFPVALSDKNEESPFFSAVDSVYSSLVKPIGPNPSKAEVINVHCQTLDNLAASQKITAINFMKIDAEGSEIPIILGAKNTLERSPNLAIICEFSDVFQRSGERTTNDLRNLLENQGLSLFRYNTEANTLEQEPHGQKYDYVNLIACKNVEFVNQRLAENSSVVLGKWR